MPAANSGILAGRKLLPGQALYDDTWGPVILLSGLPGTRKDTYLREQLPGLPVVSPDALRGKRGALRMIQIISPGIFHPPIVSILKGGGGMEKSLSRTDKEMEEMYARHVDTVYRLCYSFLRNRGDTEDAVQSTFLKLIKSGKRFDGFEHEKAWLIVTASNVCKNMLRHWSRRTVDIEGCRLVTDGDMQADEALEALLSLPDRYKTTLYLYYYEGYSTKEIASLLRRPPATIRNHLSEARRMLKNKLKEEYDEELQMD